MSTREKIREGLKTIVLMNVETNPSGDIVFKIDGLDNVFAYLDSQGVAIKVQCVREPPPFPPTGCAMRHTVMLAQNHAVFMDYLARNRLRAVLFFPVTQEAAVIVVGHKADFP